ncbi:MAG: hypothetical protein AAFZ07_06975 [Actinomycetota bacterium]
MGTDPNDLDVTDAIVIVPGAAAAERVAARGGLAVIARPDALPLAGGSADLVRADGLFVTPPPEVAARLVAELVRTAAPGGQVVTTAQVDPGPAGPRRPVDAIELAAMLPEAVVPEPFHDRVCRKDWHRLTASVRRSSGRSRRSR